MANPQKENGYTAISNEILEAIYCYKLSGHELRMLLLVLRKTYGFNKTEDAISLSQMQKELSLSKTRCSQVINKLQLQNIVTVTENINGIGKKYKFNKDFEKWHTVTENINRYKKVKSTVTEKCNKPLQKSVSTKDNAQVPEWVNVELFGKYQQARNKKLKPASFELFFKKLRKLADQSNAPPDDILKQSIENGYQGIFLLKGEQNANSRQGNSGSQQPPLKKAGNAQSDGEPWPEDRAY